MEAVDAIVESGHQQQSRALDMQVLPTCIVMQSKPEGHHLAN
jgi:hypothetical protein